MIGAFSLWYARWCYNLPSPAKAATVLAVIAAIMSYRGEPEGFEKMFWTLVLFAFLFVELRAIDHKDQFDELARQGQERIEENNFRLVGRGIETLLSRTTALDALQEALAGINRQLAVARQGRDVRKVADLETKARAAQQQVDRISRELQALTMTPRIVEGLRTWSMGYYKSLNETHQFEFDEVQREEKAHPGDPANRRRVGDKWDKEREKREKANQADLKAFIENANSVRNELLQAIPKERWTQTDKHMQDHFMDEATADAQRGDPVEKNGAANYLEGLAQRVPPLK